jgi:hypothetical protein
MSVEAIKAIQMVYDNTTKHDWPDDIWDAICKAIEAAVEEQHKPSQSDIKHEQGEPIGTFKRQHWISGSPGVVILHKEKEQDMHDGENVYTHPPQRSEDTQPKQKPLTDEQIDYSIKKNDIVTSKSWSLTELIVVDVNWALGAVAVQLGYGGGIVVWPALSLKKEAAHGIK